MAPGPPRIRSGRGTWLGQLTSCLYRQPCKRTGFRCRADRPNAREASGRRVRRAGSEKRAGIVALIRDRGGRRRACSPPSPHRGAGSARNGPRARQRNRLRRPGPTYRQHRCETPLGTRETLPAKRCCRNLEVYPRCPVRRRAARAASRAREHPCRDRCRREAGFVAPSRPVPWESGSQSCIDWPPCCRRSATHSLHRSPDRAGSRRQAYCLRTYPALVRTGIQATALGPTLRIPSWREQRSRQRRATTASANAYRMPRVVPLGGP